MSSITDKVIAYHHPQEGAEKEAYGLYFRREGSTLRVILLQEDDDYERPLNSVLRKLSDEDVVVNSLENRFQSLHSKQLEDNGATKQKSCRLQKIMLQWAVHRLKGIEEKEWVRLSQHHRPSALLSAVGCTVACIAAGKSLASTTWNDAQRLLRSGKEMVQQLREVGEKQMDMCLYSSIGETYLSDSTLAYSSVWQESPPLGLLHKWITDFMDYQRACYMEDGHAELQQQINSCEKRLQSARERRGLLAKQADLIRKGNCYKRTHMVHSVPVEHVLFLMTAEKVTTRQYLLKDRVPFESLEDALSKLHVSPPSGRDSCVVGQRRIAAFSFTRAERPVAGTSRANGTLTAAASHPATKAESARTRTWANETHVRQLPASTREGSGMDGVESLGVVAPSPTDPSDELKGKAHASVKVKRPSRGNGRASSAGGKAAVACTVTTTAATGFVTASCSSITLADSRNGVSFLSQASSAPSASNDTVSALADVKNDFHNAQESLLACLEEHAQLAEKYSKTVDQSKQLLQMLEKRDDEIARLREALSQATRKQILADRVMALLQTAQQGTSNEGRCNGLQNSSDVSQLGLATSTAFDAGTFAKRVESLLDDTLDFVRGVTAAPVM
ncbi:hypothetical protein JIQ42_01586 [Leishmania sp. Namibia]|uniref:hypothetical protein n=1 Tax=Leishmania sp. Namibia TaxID=2802991 RepID=UPI001B7C3EA4|nr:hypothetical protein JIQ42_01586 [Leishmania sp. Namibia]